MSTLAVVPNTSHPDAPFRGVPFFLNGKTYIVPSLSLKQFQQNYDALTAPVDAGDASSMSAQFARYVPIILLAFKRNYPDVTEENLYDWLDLSTFRDMLLTVQGASGMKQAEPGE
jgi:hypothetical protein